MGYFIKHSSVVTLRRRKHMHRPGSVKKGSEKYRRASDISASLTVIYLAIGVYKSLVALGVTKGRQVVTFCSWVLRLTVELEFPQLS